MKVKWSYTMNDLIKLLPCPFCGGEAEIFVARQESYGYYDETRAAGCKKQPVRCASSPAFGTQEFLQGKGMVVVVDTNEKAAAMWNTRAPIGGDLFASQDYIRKIEGYLVAFIGLIVISDELGLTIKETLEAGCSESTGGS